MPTTTMLTPITMRLRKNKKSRSAVTANAAPMKYPISSFTLLVISTRMKGSPLKYKGIPCAVLHSSVRAVTSSTKVPRYFESNNSGSMNTVINVASRRSLYSNPS